MKRSVAPTYWIDVLRVPNSMLPGLSVPECLRRYTNLNATELLYFMTSIEPFTARLSLVGAFQETMRLLRGPRRRRKTRSNEREDEWQTHGKSRICSI